MTHPYPPHHPDLPYTGKLDYFLTFCTIDSHRIFIDTGPFELVRAQFLRAARERCFEIPAYCFMPDHVHLLIRGLSDGSSCKEFIKSAKQYSGYYYKQAHGRSLWQRYGYERMIRDDMERALVIGYIVANPVRAGLANHPSEYSYLGSQVHTVGELLEMCEYSRKWL